MTVSRLRTELTDAELVHFAAFYEIKNEEHGFKKLRLFLSPLFLTACYKPPPKVLYDQLSNLKVY